MSLSKELPSIKTATPGLKVFPSYKGNKYTATYKGFFFIYHREGSHKQIFRCSESNKGCRARIYLSSSYKSVVCDERSGEEYHNHESNPGKSNAKNVCSSIKTAAYQSTETPSEIIASQIQEVTPAVLGSLPSLPNLRRRIRHARTSAKDRPINATTRSDIPHLGGRFMFEGGEDFLKADETVGRNLNNRILIFSTNKNLEWLERSEHWFCDGTFKSAPLLFEQFFIIHGMRTIGQRTLSFPLVYCLLPNKTQTTYTALCRSLKNLCPLLNPTSIMIDFETALRNSCRQEFPNATIRGCFFHFRQANSRNIRGHPDAKELKDENPEGNLELRKLIALAFVPENDVVRAFQELETSRFFTTNAQKLEPYLSYFSSNWIGGYDRRGVRKDPTFLIKYWNCYNSVLQDLPKTNNFCEGFHRAFSSLLSASHPALDTFIKALMKKQKLTEVDMEHFVAGTISPANPEVVKNAERLKRTVQRYGTLSTLDYLRAVAYSFSL